MSRAGERPLVSIDGPQRQLTQQSPPELWERFVASVFELPSAVEGRSGVSPASSRAVFLDGVLDPPRPDATLAPGKRFEPAHVQGPEDTSVHLVLPAECGGELTARGWAEPHAYADFGTEWLVYGPRDLAELEFVLAIVRESIAWALGVAPAEESRSG